MFLSLDSYRFVRISLKNCWTQFKIEDSMRKFIQKSQLQIKENGLYSLDQRLVLIALRQDMETDPVGVSSCFFTITKNFLSSVT